MACHSVNDDDYTSAAAELTSSNVTVAGRFGAGRRARRGWGSRGGGWLTDDLGAEPVAGSRSARSSPRLASIVRHSSCSITQALSAIIITRLGTHHIQHPGWHSWSGFSSSLAVSVRLAVITAGIVAVAGELVVAKRWGSHQAASHRLVKHRITSKALSVFSCRIGVVVGLLTSETLVSITSSGQRAGWSLTAGARAARRRRRRGGWRGGEHGVALRCIAGVLALSTSKLSLSHAWRRTSRRSSTGQKKKASADDELVAGALQGGPRCRTRGRRHLVCGIWSQHTSPTSHSSAHIILSSLRGSACARARTASRGERAAQRGPRELRLQRLSSGSASG